MRSTFTRTKRRSGMFLHFEWFEWHAKSRELKNISIQHSCVSPDRQRCISDFDEPVLHCRWQTCFVYILCRQSVFCLELRRLEAKLDAICYFCNSLKWRRYQFSYISWCFSCIQVSLTVPLKFKDHHLEKERKNTVVRPAIAYKKKLCGKDYNEFYFLNIQNLLRIEIEMLTAGRKNSRI